MKKYVMGSLLCLLSATTSANVCNIEGKVARVIPSHGVAGLAMTGAITGCTCDYEMIWIDTESNGGKAMYAAALAAKLNSSPVRATIQDGQGGNSPGNAAITYRYLATCKLEAFEML